MANLNPSFYLARRKRSFQPDALIIFAAMLSIVMVLWAALTPVRADEQSYMNRSIHNYNSTSNMFSFWGEPGLKG